MQQYRDDHSSPVKEPEQMAPISVPHPQYLPEGKNRCPTSKRHSFLSFTTSCHYFSPFKDGQTISISSKRKARDTRYSFRSPSYSWLQVPFLSSSTLKRPCSNIQTNLFVLLVLKRHMKLVSCHPIAVHISELFSIIPKKKKKKRRG